MNKETVALLILPPIFMALAAAIHVAVDPVSSTAIWVLVALAFATALACLVRAITLLRGGRPKGYIFGAAGILYIVLLVIMCTPAKTKMAAQQARFSQQPPALPLSTVAVGSSLPSSLGALVPGGCG